MSKFQKFDEDIDFGHAKININTNNINNTQNISNEFNVGQQNLNNNIDNKQKSSSQELSTNAMNKIISNLNFVGKYFNVEIDDIKKKLIHSLIPFKKGFYELAENTPDLYGPFWIYTTLIFIVVVSSNISAFLNV